MLRIAFALIGSRSMPFRWTVNPKNFLEEMSKAHFKGFILRLYLRHRLKTLLRSSMCWSSSLDLTTISST